MEKSIHTAEYGSFLQLLRQTRVESNITQVGLAEKLETTQVFISKVERGDRRLDVIELRQWCVALGIELDDFARRLTAVCDENKAVPAGRSSKRHP